MFRKACLTLGATIALAAQPVAAQDEMPDEDAFAAMAQMFTAEPLTEEQKTRLPLANQIIAKMIPEGAMQEMMDSMMGGMLQPLMQMEADKAAQEPAEFVADQLGLSEEELNISGEQATELADMFDPARVERKQREAALFPSLMNEMMGAMEPTMRRVMAELYAINFNEAELKDIDAFFSTESGASFARKSFTMASDPRMVAGTMEALPDMMGVFANMEQRVAEATADLPAARTFSELTAAERAKISAATGYDEENLDDWSSSKVENLLMTVANEDAVEEAASE